MSSSAAMQILPTSTFSRIACALALASFIPACGGVPAKASPDDPAGNFSQVSTGIYRGGRPDQPGIAELQKMGVKTIIDLENDDTAIKNERGWAEAAGIQFVSEPMDGTQTPNDKEVNDTLAKINDPANQPVFVHCMQGHDRTGVIIALYRVIFENWAPKAAHDEMMALGYNPLLIAMNHYFEEKTGWED
jgi:protein tyrosine/serine phosphatase